MPRRPVSAPALQVRRKSSRPRIQRARWAATASGCLARSHRRLARLLGDGHVGLQVGKAQQGQPGLARAEEFARPALLQIAPRDFESVAGLEHGAQPLARHLRQRRLVQQHADRLGGAAPDPAAQLVQLRQPEALGMLDDHQRRVRHVDSDFDDRGGDQQVDLALAKRAHDLGLLGLRQASVDQPDAQVGQGGAHRLVGIDRRLQLQRLALFHQGTDPVRLPSLARRMGDMADDLFASGIGHQQ